MADRVNRSSGRLVRKNLRDIVIEEQQRRIEELEWKLAEARLPVQSDTEKSEASLDCEEEDFRLCAVKSQGPFLFYPRGRTLYRSRERSRKKDHAPERPHGPIFDSEPDEFEVEPPPTTTTTEVAATTRSVVFRPSDFESDHIPVQISTTRVQNNFQIAHRTTDAPSRAACRYQIRHRTSVGPNDAFPTSERRDPHMPRLVSPRRSQRRRPHLHPTPHAPSRATRRLCIPLPRAATRSRRPPSAAAGRQGPKTVFSGRFFGNFEYFFGIFGVRFDPVLASQRSSDTKTAQIGQVKISREDRSML